MGLNKSRPMFRCSGWGDDCLDCPYADDVPDGCTWDCPTCAYTRRCPCVSVEAVRAYWVRRGEARVRIDDHLLVDLRRVEMDPRLPLKEDLRALVEAIRRAGVPFPLVVEVAPNRNGWERYRVLDALSQRMLLAAQEAEVAMVPVVVKENLSEEEVQHLRDAVAALCQAGGGRWKP